MQKWERLDAAPSPGGELVLWRRGVEYQVRVGNNELMGSREHGSEDALGTLGCEGLRSSASVLVGGLGLGFTLAGALSVLSAKAEVTVAEANPVIVRWNEAWLGALAGEPLKDERVSVYEGDVADALRQNAWDAVLLDVDNGPEALSMPSNAGLYDESGLMMIHAFLKPRGRLGVWSVSDDARFTKRLERAGFRVEQHRPPAWPGAKRRHWLWMAERGA